jgi:glutamine synthetase
MMVGCRGLEGDEASGALRAAGLFVLKEACMAQVESKNRATSSEQSRREILARIQEEGVQFVLLWFTDIEGHLKSFAITPSEIEDALDDGMGFDGSSITGFNAIEESDMIAIPDPETFQLMPSREGETKVGRMICDVVTPDGKPYEGDPRHVLRLALERMESLGFDTFNVGPELEYFLFKDPTGTEPLDEGGYFAMTTLDAATELRQETISALHSMGIPVEYAHHEVGPSQHEIDMRYASALDMADHTITYRLIVKEIAAKNGVYATFMPKPLFGENGSGMHTHQSLFANGRNALFDADDEWHLSAAGKAFIAGQLHHAREIAAVFAQWVNSYKRLVPGYEAPVYVAWSRRNRSALIRIPLYKPGAEQATRAEIRCPDPACNPYLTFATLLHAGLEGIERGYELPEPMETNLYHLTAEQRRERGIIALPETLGEAIDELAESELARKALGPHIFDRYVELKRSEWDEYRVQLTRWEMEKYLPVL